jgi:hypothetical protein
MTALADGLTNELQVSVIRRRVTERNSAQKPTAYTDTTMGAVFEERLFRPRVVGGVEVVPSGRLVFPRPVDFNPDTDVVVFADGTVARVIDVAGPKDPNGSRYLTEVYLGEKK